MNYQVNLPNLFPFDLKADMMVVNRTQIQIQRTQKLFYEFSVLLHGFFSDDLRVTLTDVGFEFSASKNRELTIFLETRNDNLNTSTFFPK